MKNLILSIILILLSCKKSDNKINKTEFFQKVPITDIINKSSNNIETIGIDELTLPFCLKIDTIPKSNYYQINLDTFLIYHDLKCNNLSENKKFHKNTIDFVSDRQAIFMHYPYNGKAYAVKKLTINDKITAIFYAYLFSSEMIQPRIEIQTFDNNQRNIDNLIIASTFSSECSGYRDFCISQNNIITINNYYYCSDIDIEYKNQYKYKISDIGTFVFTK